MSQLTERYQPGRWVVLFDAPVAAPTEPVRFLGQGDPFDPWGLPFPDYDGPRVNGGFSLTPEVAAALALPVPPGPSDPARMLHRCPTGWCPYCGGWRRRGGA